MHGNPYFFLFYFQFPVFFKVLISRLMKFKGKKNAYLTKNMASWAICGVYGE